MSPLLAFFGDDFTGTVSTAHLLSNLGVSTVVFTAPPSRQYLEDYFPDTKAVGVAGQARTWSPDEMDHLLPPIFERMKEYGASVFLYKISSTFDSAPHIGSVGRAIEIGRTAFSSGLVPVIPAAPMMGRMTVFGNHFAAAEDGHIYRLDRQRSTADHPTTPMRESDLLRHLADQTDVRGGLVDVYLLEGGPVEVEDRLEGLEREGVSIALFDGLFDRHIDVACETLWKRASSHRPMFVVGSHEVGAGFGRVFRNTGMVLATSMSRDESVASEKGPILVVSGSCSSMTRLQILDAIDSGFGEIAVDAASICDPSTRQDEESRIIKACREHIAAGRSVVAHTCMGPADPRIAGHRVRAKNESRPIRELNDELGDALGRIAARLLQLTGLRRIAVAGGDTSGRVLGCLGVNALQVARTPGDGQPICYIHSDDPDTNGIEVALKGGQVGGVHYLSDVRASRTVDFEVDMQRRAEEKTDVTE